MDFYYSNLCYIDSLVSLLTHGEYLFVWKMTTYIHGDDYMPDYSASIRISLVR